MTAKGRTKWLRAVRNFPAEHAMVWDAVVGLPCVLLVLLSVPDLGSRFGDGRGPIWAVTASGLFLLWSVPLLWRRSRPAQATAFVVAGHVLQLATTDMMLPGNVVVPVMLYAVARYETRRVWSGVCLGTALVGAVLAGMDWTFGADWGSGDRFGSFLGVVTSCVLVALSSWGFGLLARQRQLLVRQLRDRAEALERERDQRTRLAAEEERTRIAREMHDVVAHSLSVIVVQADGAAYAIRHGDPAASAEIAHRSLSTIGTTARDALADTRRLVAVLRGGDDAPEYVPQAGVGDLDRLIAPLREAGRRVDVAVTGPPLPLPRDVDLAVYRVVQESLTNVIKHAGSQATVRVDLAYRENAVTVRIADDGFGAGLTDDGRGHGLIGMRERVAAYGGTLHAGPCRSGGFTVTASVPLGRAGAEVVAAGSSPARTDAMPQDVVAGARPPAARVRVPLLIPTSKDHP